MKPDRVIIRLAFPHPIYGTFTPVKVEYEYPLGPDGNDQDALDDGKERAEAWFNSRYPPVDKFSAYGCDVTQGIDVSRPTSGPLSRQVEKDYQEDKRIAIIISDIYSCAELKVLESYKFVAKQSPEIQSAYNQMFEKLSK